MPAGFSAYEDARDSDQTADLYDPATGTWSLTANLNSRRARQGAMVLHDGRVVTGPGSQAFVFGPPAFAMVNTKGEVFNPAANAWHLTGDVGIPGRFNFQFTTLPNGKALIAGGITATGAITRTSEVYDPATNTWASGGTLTHDHGTSSSLANSHNAVVLSASTSSFVFDPRVCGSNCGKVLVLGDNLTDGVADLYTPAPVPLTCSRTITGQVTGDVNVAADTVTCLTNAQVRGSVNVAPGGAVVLTNATILGNVAVDGAAGVRICGSRITGTTSITHSFGPVQLGSTATAPDCGYNTFSDTVTLDANQAVAAGDNRFVRNVSLIWTAGAVPSARLEANTFSGNLSCANNTPAPTNGARPNVVRGLRQGQCSGRL